MRIWSIHPRYLDPKGLVALWREGLLAHRVLQGRIRGYIHHPQLVRFRLAADPVAAITAYLWSIFRESLRRGYCFDEGKLGAEIVCPPITVTTGQLEYEWRHLKMKLDERNPGWRNRPDDTVFPDSHPLFSPIDGPVESWERIR